MKAYPNAKIILSVRDPKKWYRSVKNTIFYGYMMNRTFPTNIFCMLNRSRSKGWENICDRLAKLQTNGLDIGNCYVIVFIVSYREITNSRFSLTQSKPCIF